MPELRPPTVPEEATFNPGENEWETGDRNADDQPIGPWIWWHPTGERACEASYDGEGELHGMLERWHTNGERSQWAPWVHGKTHGIQVWTRPTSGEADPSSVLPPNLPDRVVRMDMPYEHGVGKPSFFTLYLEAGRDNPVPTDDRGRCLDLAAHAHRIDEDTVLLPTEDSFQTLDGDEVAADANDGRWIYQGPVEGGFLVMHRCGSDGVKHAIGPQELSRVFTLAADWFLTWRDQSRPVGVPDRAVFEPRESVWSDGSESNGQREGEWTTWRSDGSLRARQSYVRGSLDGPFECLHPDGSVAQQGAYRRGGLIGTTVWLRNEETDQAFPRAGELVHRVEHDQEADRTSYFLGDGRLCNRHGVPLPEAWCDERFAEGPDGFLSDGFLAYLDAFCPQQEQAPRQELADQLEHLYGHPVAADVLAVLGETMERDPALVEWRMGVDVLEPSDEGEVNTFEQLLHINQESYLSCDLIELFSGTLWVGSLGNGDGYLVSLVEPELGGGAPGKVYLYAHDELGMGHAVAPSLSHLAYLAALQDAWRDTESISPEGLRASALRLDGVVNPPWHFGSLFEEVDVDLLRYAPEDELSRYLFAISHWIIALLRNDDIVEVDDMADYFHEDLFPAMDGKPWPERMALAARHVPIGLYWIWRLFFFGDDERLGELVEACRSSEARILRDAARLMGEILDGRKEVGTIENIHDLREAFQALDLDPSRAEARAAEANAAQIEAERHTAEVETAVAAAPAHQLLPLAWQHLDDAVWRQALISRWREQGNPHTWSILDTLREVRVESLEGWSLIHQLKVEADPCLVPVLISLLRTGESHPARSVLAALRPVEAAGALLPLLDREERYHHDHTAIAELLGEARLEEAVPALSAALQLPMEGLEKNRNEDYVAASLCALGRIGSPAAVQAIRGALGVHPTPLVASALADAGAVDMVGVLGQMLPEQANAALLWALARLAPDAEPCVLAPLRERVRSIDERGLAVMTVRGHLLRVLGDEVDDLRRWVRSSLAVQTLPYGEDRSIAQKSWALRVAGEHGDIEPEVIEEWVHYEHAELREVALEAGERRGIAMTVRVLAPFELDALEAEQGLAGLHRALHDRAVVLRHLVVDRIAGHGDASSLSELCTALDHFLESWQPAWLGMDTPRLLRSLVAALRGIDAPESIAALRRCLEDERDKVRDPVLRELLPPHADFLPGMVEVERSGVGWMKDSATEWLEAFPDPEAVAAQRG